MGKTNKLAFKVRVTELNAVIHPKIIKRAFLDF